MITDLFSRVEPAWISSSNEASQSDSIVLLSSVKLRRNIEGFRFPGKAGKSDLYDSAAAILGGIGRSEAWNDCDFRMVDNLDNFSRYLLLELKLITPILAQGGPGRFFLRDSKGVVTCMINEEDHFTLCATNPGLELMSCLEKTQDLEKGLDALPIVRDTVLGYLTANPSYVGSGMTAAVLLHLPALDALDEMAKVCEFFERDWKNLALYKLLSDRENPTGSFYLLTNRTTLSITPAEIVNLVDDAAQALVSKELFARHRMLSAKDEEMSDKFWRAWGLLRHARKLSFSEAVATFSFIKLGSDLGILPFVDNREWRRMVIGTQRHHLSLTSQQIIEQSEEAYVRAARFRQFIESKSSSPTVSPSALENKEL